MALIAGVDVPLLEATAALPAPGQTLAAFILALRGQVIDSCGGFPAGQCTALACAWCRNLGLGTPCGFCGTANHCDGACWVGGHYPGWTWIPNTPAAVPVPGDLVAYYANCSVDGIGASGHVGIFVSGDAHSFTGFDQNWCDSSCACELHTHGYECVIGWHHPNVNVANPCNGVFCDACSSCTNGVCVSTCIAGESCIAGECTAPGPPPGTSTAHALLVAGLILGPIAALGIWEAKARPGMVAALERRLAGGGTSLGARRGEISPVGRPVRRNAVDRPTPRRGRRVALPSGESFGAGLARSRGALENRAVATYGTAPVLSDASFVLPDGTLLAWPRGTGPIRTRESSKHHPDLALELTGDARLQPLLDRGWMRVQNFRDVLVTTVGEPITPAQAARVRAGAEPFDKLVMEAESAWLDRPRCESTPPEPSAINRCVTKVNTEIVEGRARHAELLERMRLRHPELLR